MSLIMIMILGFSESLKAFQTEPRRPNVIVILTDDQGYADVSYHGNTQIPTPNIDRIADAGVIFSEGYVTHPVCGPSRAGLITGRYQSRFGSDRNPLFAPKDTTQGLPLSEENMAEALGKANYQSSYLGKWHLGSHHLMSPRQRGFNEFFGFLTGGHRYFPSEWTLRDKSEVRSQFEAYRTKIMRNNGRVDENEYITDALSREAVDFVARQDGTDPFFMFVSYNAPHNPLQATQKYLDRFPNITDTKRKTYAAMVSAVDDGVGAIIDKLQEKNMFENTIIFFLTDNGGASSNGSSNAPLRGYKGSFYEGGIRVPFAMSWPAVVPAGMTYDNPVSTLDIMATAVAEAGVTTKRPLDGVNLVPYLTGDSTGVPHKQLFWRNPDRNTYVVRSGDLKLINDSGNITVFDIKANPSEQTSSEMPYDAAQHGHLLQSIEDWKKELVEPRYLGLGKNDEYNRQNPDRWDMQNPYEPDGSIRHIPEGHSLIWDQEFNGSGAPDTAWWNYEQGFVRNRELQWYQPDNVQQSGGVLNFEARRETVQNPDYDASSDNWRLNRAQADYTSSSIRSEDKFTFKYGVMEVRARIDTAKGYWPAIWTLGAERNWPNKGEVDLMEFYRRDDVPFILANAAWYGEDTGNVFWDGSSIPLTDYLEDIPDFPERFHTWRMEWDPDFIKLYLNNKLLNTVSVEEATYSDGFNPFRQPHFILLNLAIGSNGGDPSNTIFPLNYEVDYVRVFKKKSSGSGGIDTTSVNDIDGNSYRTVDMGDLMWMAENLHTTRFSNGDEIPLIASDGTGDTDWSQTTSPGRTVFQGNTNLTEEFGFLYNHHAVTDERGICPENWRIPNEEDWKKIETLVGVDLSDLERDGWAGADANAAGKLKSTSSMHWESPNSGATDEYGFSWTGGSTRYAGGSFAAAESIYRFGSLWSADEFDSDKAYRRLVRYDRTDIRRNAVPKGTGLGIRCVSEQISVDSEKESYLPEQWKLNQNFPNPFNPSTQISFELPIQSKVRLAVFDLLGREISVLLDGNMLPGYHQVNFNASALSSGIYLYRLTSSMGSLMNRMTLIK